MSEPNPNQTDSLSPLTKIVDYDALEPQVDALSASYRSSQPFPHHCFSGFLTAEAAERVEAEFPRQADENWIRYRHVNENKASIDTWEGLPPTITAVIRELNSPRFLSFVSEITGIEGLVADPDIEGGGMHQAWAGGFLNVHKDFTMHRQKPTWRRRCNLILYLNKNWDPAWGGSIELWEQGMAECSGSLEPLINNALLFNTPNALHGFPDPLKCPPDQTRKSIQLYYYTIDEKAVGAPTATTYFSRPQDSTVKRLAVQADNQALRVYAWLKRKLGIPDSLISRIAGWFTEYRTRPKD